VPPCDHRRVQDGPLIARFGRARRDPQLAVLEGLHALKHALRFGADVDEVVTVDRDALAQLARELAADVADEILARARPVDARIFAELVPNPPPTGVLALAARPPFAVRAALCADPGSPAVLLENPRDLGNLGAAIRVSAAAGAAALVSSGSHDPWHPDAIRGAAGLHFALPVGRVASLVELDGSGRRLVALDPEGDELGAGELGPGVLLAFGTERDGVSGELLERAEARVRLPMRPGVSSLNLATAVAAALYSLR